MHYLMERVATPWKAPQYGNVPWLAFHKIQGILWLVFIGCSKKSMRGTCSYLTSSASQNVTLISCVCSPLAFSPCSCAGGLSCGHCCLWAPKEAAVLQQSRTAPGCLCPVRRWLPSVQSPDYVGEFYVSLTLSGNTCTQQRGCSLELCDLF